MFPNQMIKTFVGKTVRVELKGEESTLIGKLEGMDDYMNLYLSDNPFGLSSFYQLQDKV